MYDQNKFIINQIFFKVQSKNLLTWIWRKGSNKQEVLEVLPFLRRKWALPQRVHHSAPKWPGGSTRLLFQTELQT